MLSPIDISMIIWAMLIVCGFPINELEYHVFMDTNKQRVKYGLEELTWNEKLTRSAQQQSFRMSNLNKLSHDVGGNLINRINGYQYLTVGENIAWNYTEDEVVNGWMLSPGHRRNILNEDFDEIGVGVYWNDKGEPYYCQIFGKSMKTYKAFLKTSLGLFLIMFIILILRQFSKNNRSFPKQTLMIIPNIKS